MPDVCNHEPGLLVWAPLQCKAQSIVGFMGKVWFCENDQA